MPKNLIKIFFKSEFSVGLILFLVTIFALLIANSGNSSIYQDFFSINFPINFLNFSYDLTIKNWINDGLMAIFFLLVGCELKKEILIGELSSKKKLIFPLVTAFGGMVFPMLVFFYFNFNHPENFRGFAIPSATDIAFAYGVISFFGKKISNAAKVFLVALAIIDDLLAILIIVFFYSGQISFNFLTPLILLALLFLNYKNSENIFLYLLFGIILWMSILNSGIHASLAGFVLAMFFPLKIISKIAHQISPTVNFFILPIFAFANSFVPLQNFSTEVLFNSLFLGIALGLFLGKQLGIMLTAFFLVKTKICNLPRTTNWRQFYGVAIFSGIGFTMSLFISELALQTDKLNHAKIAILIGSLMSLIFGSIIIFFYQKQN